MVGSKGGASAPAKQKGSLMSPPDAARPPVPVYYRPEYVLAAHAFDTTRKAAWVAESLADAPIAGLELRAPRPLADAELFEIHTPGYVEAVRTGVPRELAESQGFSWDPSLWDMVCASNGGAVAAALSALEGRAAGSLSSGLHHARRSHGAGSCTFNGLALAAKAALRAGARRVLVLDLDAHCGGGTHELIADDERVWHIDVSVSDYDAYAPSARSSLDLVASANDYLPAVTRRLEAIERDGPPFDLCLYNAGMDPHEGCPEDGLAGITDDTLASREVFVFRWCRRRRLPIAFVLAGGYVGERLDRDHLVRLHRLTLRAAADV
jgi:acetoin utilization deacetylase AcuC-like enzyme